MTSVPVGIERRVGQRFPYLLSLSLRQLGTSMEGVGFTQDLSSRGVFFFTNAALIEGSEIELTLRMPSEITLGDTMPVRCRGRILRIVRPLSTADSSQNAPKIGVAVRFEGYEYLPDSSQHFATFPRVSTLHSHSEEERSLTHPAARPVLG
jgi:PilZ domain